MFKFCTVGCTDVGIVGTSAVCFVRKLLFRDGVYLYLVSIYDILINVMLCIMHSVCSLFLFMVFHFEVFSLLEAVVSILCSQQAAGNVIRVKAY